LRFDELDEALGAATIDLDGAPSDCADPLALEGIGE
jgi:hypothetical protein